MNTRLRNVAVAILFLTAGFALAQESDSELRVVMVSIDGLKPEYFLDNEIQIPNLRRLRENGTYADGVVGVLPSVTYPSHTTLITGVLPRVHGIVSNHVLDPEGIGDNPWYWFARDIKVPTLVHAAEARGKVTGSVSWPVSIGLPADYNMPEFWRGRSSHPFDRRFMEVLSTPGMVEAAGRWRGKEIPSFSEMTDRDRTDVALWMIESAKPDFLLFHIFGLDWASHRGGPFSKGALSTLEESDQLLGELLEAIEKIGAADSTVVFVVSDHGFLDVTSVIRPNTLLIDEGLIRLDDRGRISDWDAYFLCDDGSAALVLHDPTDVATLERVTKLLDKKAAEEGSGITIIDRETAWAAGSNAQLVIDAKDGFSVNSGLRNGWKTEIKKKGSHGFYPDRPGVHATLIISGPAVSSRGSLGIVRMTQIAPTVAEMMRLVLSEEADEALEIEWD